MQTILVLVGGISQGSLNKKLFRAFEAQKPENFELKTFDISKLPFFSQDLEIAVPQVVTEFKAAIQKASGILFITPEYNHSFPGVLKNALDWGSRPSGQNSWQQKPAGLAGASAGNIGTFGAQAHLRHVLAALNMPTLMQPEFYLNGSHSFDEQGRLTDEKTKTFIDKYWKSYAAWVLDHLKNLPLEKRG